MLLEETLRKLTDLKLHGMVRALRDQMNAPPGDRLSFDEQLGMVVDREWSERDNRRLGRRLKEARLATSSCLEDVHCDPTRGLDKATVRTLSTGHWIRAKQNVIVVGATGVGKSFLGARPGLRERTWSHDGGPSRRRRRRNARRPCRTRRRRWPRRSPVAARKSSTRRRGPCRLCFAARGRRSRWRGRARLERAGL